MNNKGTLRGKVCKQTAHMQCAPSPPLTPFAVWLAMVGPVSHCGAFLSTSSVYYQGNIENCPTPSINYTFTLCDICCVRSKKCSQMNLRCTAPVIDTSNESGLPSCKRALPAVFVRILQYSLYMSMPTQLCDLVIVCNLTQK